MYVLRLPTCFNQNLHLNIKLAQVLCDDILFTTSNVAHTFCEGVAYAYGYV